MSTTPPPGPDQPESTDVPPTTLNTYGVPSHQRNPDSPSEAWLDAASTRTHVDPAQPGDEGVVIVSRGGRVFRARVECLDYISTYDPTEHGVPADEHVATCPPGEPSGFISGGAHGRGTPTAPGDEEDEADE